MKRARRLPAGPLAAAAVALAFGLAPLRAATYQLLVLFTFLRYVVMAQAWNLLAGYTGLLSLGNHAFVGVGAYGMTLLLLHLGWPLWAGLLAAGVVAAAFGVLTYLPLFRLRGGYFAISTLLLGLVVQAVVMNSKGLGASGGLIVSPPLPSMAVQFLMAWGIFLAYSAVQEVILRTRAGLYLRAVRDDEEAARAVGTRPLTVKTGAVAVSAFFTGLAGGLVAMQLVSIEPNSAFSLNWLLDMVVMVVIGGSGTRLGPVLGAVVIVAIEQFLADYEVVYVLLKAVLLIVAVQVAPRGLMGLGADVRARLARRREVIDGAPAGGA